MLFLCSLSGSAVKIYPNPVWLIPGASFPTKAVILSIIADWDPRQNKAHWSAPHIKVRFLLLCCP